MLKDMVWKTSGSEAVKVVERIPLRGVWGWGGGEGWTGRGGRRGG